MSTEDRVAAGGPLSRMRAARGRVALLAAPETARAKTLTLAALVALAVAIAALTLSAGVKIAPPLTLAVPVVLGGLLLDLSRLRVLLVVVGAAMILEVIVEGWDDVRPGSLVVMLLIAGIVVELARDRERLGLSGGRGDSMLLELRDQLALQGELPPLPAGWSADVAQRSAGGSTFGGDFMVSRLTDEGKRLELALVDVSGKGIDAGTRALMLSGALGGLLGAVPPEQFFIAANDYLMRQEWDEGFATALHVIIDLVSGHYRLTNAGHPPAAHYAGGSGRWGVVDVDGIVLGLDPQPRFGVAEGVLAPSDALLLYTDGLVEVPGRDLAFGIDRLLGAVEGLIPRGFAGGAELIVSAVAPDASDDSAVILLWRS